MELSEETREPILLMGEGDLLASIATCLVDAGHQVNVYPSNPKAFTERYNQHNTSKTINGVINSGKGSLNFLTKLTYDESISLVIAIFPEDFNTKVCRLQEIESAVCSKTIIAINTETYSLPDLNVNMKNGRRLIGLNWTEPAHTTLFLEIIGNDDDQITPQKIVTLSKKWGKDAYVVKNSGVRSLLIAAMAREASFLVDNDYASVEDIDRACRNDTGYYLPFAGNCRYMDLMGTYAYGMVMKDLNPELTKDEHMPNFFEKIESEGGLGMENRHGFYNYSEDEVKEWKEKMDKFSYQIHKIIDKYPFNYNADNHLD